MPQHNPDFKGSPKVTGKGKKVDPSRKTAQGRRSAPSKRSKKPFRLVVTKEGKTPKSSPFAETHPHMTEMRVEMAKKPFRLEVGKTYETADGSCAVTIDSVSAGSAWGVFIRADIPSFIGSRDRWQRATGLWYDAKEDGGLGLVREVPGAKRPRGASAKGSNPPKSKRSNHAH